MLVDSDRGASALHVDQIKGFGKHDVHNKGDKGKGKKGKQPAMAATLGTKNEVCNFWRKRSCKAGRACPFLHPLDEEGGACTPKAEQWTPETPPPTPRPKGKAKAGAHS